MILPWNREQRQAETRARWGWIVGGTLAAGLLAAAAVWLMRTAKEQAASRIGTMDRDNDHSPDIVRMPMPASAIETDAHVMDSAMQPAPKKRASRRKTTNTASIANVLPEDLSKMGSGAEDLKNHDFPALVSSHRSAEEDPIIVNQDSMPPEGIQAGGPIGEMPGDTQPMGEVTSIMDQDELTPDFVQEEG